MLNITNTDTDFMRRFKSYLMSLDYCGNEYGFKKPNHPDDLLDQESQIFHDEAKFLIQQEDEFLAFSEFIESLSGVFKPEWKLSPCFETFCDLLECSPEQRRAAKNGYDTVNELEQATENMFTLLTFQAMQGVQLYKNGFECVNYDGEIVLKIPGFPTSENMAKATQLLDSLGINNFVLEDYSTALTDNIELLIEAGWGIYGFKKIIVPSGHHDKTIKGLMFVNERV